jgi:hypothetical protein
VRWLTRIVARPDVLSIDMKPSPATVIASIALFVAVGGPAEAAKLINGSNIKRGTISSKQVKDRGLGVRDLSTSARRSLRRTPARSVGTAQLLEGAVGAAQIRPGSITAAALTPDAVAGSNIIDKQVGTADLADSAVTAGKLATGSVRKSEIAAGAVGTAELGTGAVTAEKLADGAISPAKLPDGSITTAKIAPNAITGALVADGGLGAADIGEASGGVPLDFPAIDDDACASLPATGLSVPSGANLGDDVVLVSPPVGWPAGIQVSARATGQSSVAVDACNVGGGGAATNPASGTFRILAITP